MQALDSPIIYRKRLIILDEGYGDARCRIGASVVSFDKIVARTYVRIWTNNYEAFDVERFRDQ